MNEANFIALPVALPLLLAVGLLFFRLRPTVQRAGLVTATALNLAAAIWLFRMVRGKGEPVIVGLGGWDIPVGIGFHADLLSAIMVLVAAIIAFAGACYALGEIGQGLWRKHYSFFYLLLITGINGAFLTGDLFNLFVWFEVMLMASFAMLVLGRRKYTIEGATKYVVINMISSFFFLAGIGILYGVVGSLNISDIALRLAEAEAEPLLLTSAALLLMAFGGKAGVFPLYFWLPASYPHTQFTTAAVFGGLLTKVGVYALFRVFGGAFAFLSDITGTLFILVGAASMLTGVLGAASQFHTRRILSFHIVSQIGYLILGLGLFTVGAFAAAIFYTVHHIFVKSNLFLAAGLIARAGGSERLDEVGGLLLRRPFLALLFAIPALSLAGIPPLSGFFAKFLIIREAFRAEAYLWGGVALLVGLLTLFSMVKIWSEAFWKDHPSVPRPARERRVQMIPVAGLATLTLLIGFFADPLHDVAVEAAVQLLEQNPHAGDIPTEVPLPGEAALSSIEPGALLPEAPAAEAL